MPAAAPTLADIRAAYARIMDSVHATPLLTSRLLNELAGGEIHFKAEHLQRCGAFKARGASNAVLSLSDAEAARGVATHSSGNHGAALALAAAQRGIPAWVVMPDNAPRCKREATIAYGAHIVPCAPTLAAREATLAAVVAEHGATAVHPYKDPRVIAGQGTLALELLQQVPALDTVIVPVGGGGLLGGVAIVIKALRPDVRVIAAEPAGANDAWQSFTSGVLTPVAQPATIADGLRATIGDINFELMRQWVDDVVTVEEDAIIEAMRLQWTRLKQVVEPSGAVSFAAALAYPELVRKRRAVCVITGGNVDVDQLPWAIH